MRPTTSAVVIHNARPDPKKFYNKVKVNCLVHQNTPNINSITDKVLDPRPALDDATNTGYGLI
jgi:hypothetical protein